MDLLSNHIWGEGNDALKGSIIDAENIIKILLLWKAVYLYIDSYDSLS